MNTVPFSQQEDPGKRRPLPEEHPESIHPYPPEINIADGGEFLDDSIRMKEQPLEETSEEEDQQTKFQINKNDYYEMY